MMENLLQEIEEMDYDSLDREIKQSMRRSAGEVVRLGYMLRRMKEEELWAGRHSSMDEYLEKELHMEKSLASCFMGINRRFSVDGDSVEIDSRYRDYSQSLLVEMLGMPPELAEKVTPEMTARQAREIKRAAREAGTGKACVDDAIPGQTSIAADFQEWMPEGYQEGGTGMPCMAAGSGEEPPLPQPRETGSPEEALTGEEGEPAEVAMSQQGPESDEDPADVLARIRRILRKEQETLDDYLEVSAGEDLPEKLLFRQKTIVAALAGMVCDLENAAPEEERSQPPLPLLKNNDQRKDWLKDYKAWGLWYRDTNIGVDYYKYDFENGARLVAEVYAEHGGYTGDYEYCIFHLVGGPEPPKAGHGCGKWTRHDRYSRYPNSETELVEFLKYTQGKEERRK